MPLPTADQQVEYDRLFLAHDVWECRDAAACNALIDLLLPTEAVQFSQCDLTNDLYDASLTRYRTPSSASLSSLFMPFVFRDLGSFETVSNLVTHLRSLDTSFRAACTEEQLKLAPPPLWLTLYWLVTRLPDRLSSTRDVLLLKHPTELTIDLLESTLTKIESNLHAIAAATAVAPPRLFDAVSVASWQKQGKGGRRGGKGGSGGGGGGGGNAGPGGGGGGGVAGGAGGGGGASASSGGGNARGTGLAGTTTGGVWPVAWYTAQQRQQSQQQQPQQGQQQQGPGGSGSSGRGIGLPSWALRGATPPPCPYVVRTGSHQGQPCGRLHPLGQCFAQLTDRLRAEYGFGPAPDWAPLVYSRGPSLFQMTAVELLDAL
ncbi:unnamed protein product [Closterium sp. NIES-65]|nr:unnamed protein product [Closterium sp. NIES-65]CAI6008569.1 unnamed protein product [Closterium sp. NIES-65]